MPNRRLSCLVGERCVGRLEFVQQSQAGLPGRLAGLLPAAFLATALPRRTLFQRVVLCMIDHGLLPASLRAHHGPRSCLGGWKDDPSGLQRKSLVFVGRQSGPVQSSPPSPDGLDRGQVAPCGLLIFGLLSRRVRLGRLCLGDQEFCILHPFGCLMQTVSSCVPTPTLHWSELERVWLSE